MITKKPTSYINIITHENVTILTTLNHNFIQIFRIHYVVQHHLQSQDHEQSMTEQLISTHSETPQQYAVLGVQLQQHPKPQSPQYMTLQLLAPHFVIPSHYGAGGAGTIHALPLTIALESEHTHYPFDIVYPEIILQLHEFPTKVEPLGQMHQLLETYSYT
ncbi:Hypothetical_protein [Hexamita inflata]|uniref:Hypothetical_protein n=1 Tax=Hexamita inflata TaxID=28002 RepID=A0AA86R0B6_9EUKA|nr:Hypothetical protein HINF_LOCUS54312 [Hexamita inflata]